MINRTVELYRTLRSTVAELEALHTGRKFTVDGHTLGSIAEVLVAQDRGLTLQPPSSTFDALDVEGRKVEIKGTGGNTSVPFNYRGTEVAPFDRVIVVRLGDLGIVEYVYDGQAEPVWAEVRKGKAKGLQQTVALTTLRKLQMENADKLAHKE